MEHLYSVYGISVASDIAFDLPVPAAGGRPLASVRFARGDDELFAAVRSAEPAGGAWFVCREQEDGSVYFRWSGLYEFHAEAGGAILRYRPIGTTGSHVLENFLFGQALSFALIGQNIEPVHAAVVDVGGEAIALLGDCTYGKSTLAAAFLAQGCRLLTDDVLVVQRRGSRFVAQAGTGRIKLNPDSARAVLPGHAGTPVVPSSEKRAFRLDSPMVQRAPTELRAFVVLPTPAERAGCARTALEPLNRTSLFHHLVKNTYVRYLEGRGRLRRNFGWNAELAGAVAGYALRYPSGIDRLPLVAAAVVEHVRACSQGDAA
jgi:hypothetical protein